MTEAQYEKSIRAFAAHLTPLPTSVVDQPYRAVAGEMPSPVLSHAERCDTVAEIARGGTWPRGHASNANIIDDGRD